MSGSRRGRCNGGRGFSLIELLFTVGLTGIFLGVATPSLARLNADIRTRTTAEQLAAALRLAQASAVIRNRPAAVLLTNAAPAVDAEAAANGSRWLVKYLAPASSRGGAGSGELIQVASHALQNRVTLTGPAQVCFDALGMQATEAGDGPNACAAPGDGQGGPTSYLVSRADSTRQYRVHVYRTGRVEVCDAARRVQPLASCL